MKKSFFCLSLTEPEPRSPTSSLFCPTRQEILEAKKSPAKVAPYRFYGGSSVGAPSNAGNVAEIDLNFPPAPPASHPAYSEYSTQSQQGHAYVGTGTAAKPHLGLGASRSLEAELNAEGADDDAEGTATSLPREQPRKGGPLAKLLRLLFTLAVAGGIGASAYYAHEKNEGKSDAEVQHDLRAVVAGVRDATVHRVEAIGELTDRLRARVAGAVTRAAGPEDEDSAVYDGERTISETMGA